MEDKMNDVNVIVIGGKLTTEPDFTVTESGKAVCNFSLAFRKNKDADPGFVDVVTWNRCAENCAKYLNKGARVVIHGYINQSKWIDRTGQNKSKIEVIGTTVHFLELGTETSEEVK